MADDIVTRLRNSCAHPCNLCRRENAYVVGEDAADEIQRLRQLVDMLAHDLTCDANFCRLCGEGLQALDSYKTTKGETQ